MEQKSSNLYVYIESPILSLYYIAQLHINKVQK